MRLLRQACRQAGQGHVAGHEGGVGAVLQQGGGMKSDAVMGQGNMTWCPRSWVTLAPPQLNPPSLP